MSELTDAIEAAARHAWNWTRAEEHAEGCTGRPEWEHANGDHGVRAVPGDGEQAATTCRAKWTTVVYPIAQPTTVVCTDHDGDVHRNAFTGTTWTDADAVPSAGPETTNDQ